MVQMLYCSACIGILRPFPYVSWNLSLDSVKSNSNADQDSKAIPLKAGYFLTVRHFSSESFKWSKATLLVLSPKSALALRGSLVASF